MHQARETETPEQSALRRSKNPHMQQVHNSESVDQANVKRESDKTAKRSKRKNESAQKNKDENSEFPALRNALNLG